MSNDEFSAPNSPEEIFRLPASGFLEAAAEWRESASSLREFFISLTQSGFTEAQALGLTAVVVQTAALSAFQPPREQ